MNISIEHINSAGVQHDLTIAISRLAFVKHLSIAGQGYAPSPSKFLRTIGMFFHYWFYLRSDALSNNHFSEPPASLSDPTEKNHFSNIAGKAIADFLSKRLDQSIFTVNYEAAMRLRGMRLNVGRPDLLAFTQASTFAVEAKGYDGGFGNMAAHKVQAQSGGIPVNFSVACISANMYRGIRCKYHDPFNDNISLDEELLGRLSAQYYSGLAEFLDSNYFTSHEIQIQGESFYELEFMVTKFDRLLPRPFNHPWLFEISHFFRPCLILPKAIREYATSGLSKSTQPFILQDTNKDERLYIDYDRVGLSFR